MKILKILSFTLVAFIFSSCQKCMECTNENLLGGGNGGEVDIEIEICEDEVTNLNATIDMYEADGYTCYRNIW